MFFLLSFTILPFILLSAMQGVAGHGFVHTVNVGGQDFPGWNPFDDPCVKYGPEKPQDFTDTSVRYQSPVPTRVIRKIQSDGPGQ
jgi:hypothetical protein